MISTVYRRERILVLITGHRRENFGDGFMSMCKAIQALTKRYPDVDFVYPMHLNPNVRKPIHEVFGEDLSNLGNMIFYRAFGVSLFCLFDGEIYYCSDRQWWYSGRSSRTW